MQTLIDFTAPQLRDHALTSVLAHAGTTWQESAKAIVRTMQGEFTGECIRLCCEAQGIVPPHHNAWGAIVREALREKLIVPTGEWRPMSGAKSHARITRVYRRVS